MSNSILRDLVALNMTLRLGMAEYERLVGVFGSHGALMEASSGDLQRVGGLGARLAAEVARLRTSDDPDEELRQAAERGLTVLAFHDPTYPALLRRIHNPPLVLYVEGALTEADAVAVAVVGTRHPTHYGTTQAARLTAELAARGLTILSGLARGIDTVAHRSALDGGARTVAVLGSGLARLYPPENATLADEVSGHGALVSEFPLHTPPWRSNFPRRNRIVSGLALGVLVIEAAGNSGALVTADWALEQGREVFALPGRVDRRQSRGSHRLIKQGARLIETSGDIIEGLGAVGEALAPARPKPATPTLELSGDEATVLGAIGDEPTHIDAITDTCGLPAHQVAGVLMVLEIKKAVDQLPGKLFARTAATPL